ncbi:hypothetical protein Ddc_17665 [Ditylenchus destructor]|nr:hypothetical protein Ddc_17665 [Ditylenchus destructor]
MFSVYSRPLQQLVHQLEMSELRVASAKRVGKTQSPSKDVKTAVSPTFTAGGTIVQTEQPSDDVTTATSPVYTHGGQVADADHDKTSDDVKTARSPVYNKEPEPTDSQTSNSVYVL